MSLLVPGTWHSPNAYSLCSMPAMPTPVAEGAGLVVATGEVDGDGSVASDTCLGAEAVKPTSCRRKWIGDTQCIFLAEGTTMPEVTGSAVGVATYALLHLLAALRKRIWQ